MTIKPRLQLALDHTRLDAALQTVDHLHPYVDIIEAGTILCISAGIRQWAPCVNVARNIRWSPI